MRNANRSSALARRPSRAVAAISVRVHSAISVSRPMPQKASASCAAAATEAPSMVAVSRSQLGSVWIDRREMRLRPRGPQPMVVAMAARTASARGWPPWASSQRSGSERARRASTPRIIAVANGSGASPSMSVVKSVPSSIRSTANASSVASRTPAAASASTRPFAKRCAGASRRGPTMPTAAASTALGALPASRAASAATSIALPCRFTWTAMATSISAWSFAPAGSRSRASPRFASSGFCAACSMLTPCRLETWVFGSICEAPEASFSDCRGNTVPSWRSSPRIWPR